MLPGSITVLHIGDQVSGLEYLFRVATTLVGFGGVALLIYWVVGVIDTVRSAVSAGSEAE